MLTSSWKDLIQIYKLIAQFIYNTDLPIWCRLGSHQWCQLYVIIEWNYWYHQGRNSSPNSSLKIHPENKSRNKHFCATHICTFPNSPIRPYLIGILHSKWQRARYADLIWGWVSQQNGQQKCNILNSTSSWCTLLKLYSRYPLTSSVWSLMCLCFLVHWIQHCLFVEFYTQKLFWQSRVASFSLWHWGFFNFFARCKDPLPQLSSPSLPVILHWLFLFHQGSSYHPCRL